MCVEGRMYRLFVNFEFRFRFSSEEREFQRSSLINFASIHLYEIHLYILCVQYLYIFLSYHNLSHITFRERQRILQRGIRVYVCIDVCG